MTKWAYLFFFFFYCHGLQAQIEAPNYDFNLEALTVFFPGQTLEQIKTRLGEPELMKKQDPRSLYRFSIKHARYQFPVFVEILDQKSVGFFARLPNYFLHDLFHQSLINRFGAQDEFLNRDSTSVYQWKDKEGMSLIYSGACTITCFPIYLTGFTKEEELLKKLRTD
jgi:hypothetical protein